MSTEESCSQLLEEQKQQNQTLEKMQQQIADQVNQTLGPALNALTCGPSCQRENKINELRQKFLDAQTNRLIAPQQVINAEKEYYTFAEGTAAYDAIRTKELEDKADKLVNLMKENFIEEVYNIELLIKMYNIMLIDADNTLELYNDYEESIENLNGEITGYKTKIVTNDRKTYYESQEITNLKFWQGIMFFIYYLLVVVFFLGIFLANSSYGFFKKFGIFLLLAFYPFYAGIIAKGIMRIITFITDLLPKNIYKTI
jgi:hypothetical protein